MVRLVEPNTSYKTHYIEMLEDWKSTGEGLVPFTLNFDTSDFEKFIDALKRASVKADKGFVRHSTFWMLSESGDKIIGVSNVRHYLNENLLKEGGHIGFGIRPSYRRKGYAVKILELSLKEAKRLNIEKALVTCDKSNIGSSKTILRNGGVLWKEHVHEGVAKLNYWIEIK